MNFERLPLRALAASLLWSLATVAHYTELGDKALLLPLMNRPDQAADAELPRPEGASFKRTLLTEGIYEVTYGFQSFNKDRLKVVFTIVEAELESSMKEFGWRKADVDAVMAKASSNAEAKRAAAAYFNSRGFRVTSNNTVEANVPLMVKRNSKRISGLAQEIAKIAEKREYSSEDVVAAATALVQTAVAYRIPPDIIKDWHVGGLLPPPKALINGWGDCDTKTALLAALLSNWDGMDAVGLSLPKHYLMGIRRIPRDGDAFVEYNGSQYVLIESAGPAWLPPGTVGSQTQTLLEQMNGVPIQPL